MCFSCDVKAAWKFHDPQELTIARALRFPLLLPAGDLRGFGLRLVSLTVIVAVLPMMVTDFRARVRAT